MGIEFGKETRAGLDVDSWKNGIQVDARVEILTKECSEADLDQVAEVLGKAFCGTKSTAPEQCIDFAFGRLEPNQEPSEARKKAFLWLARWTTFCTFASGGAVFVVRDNKDKDNTIISAALVRLYPVSTFQSLQGFVSALKHSLPAKPVWLDETQFPENSEEIAKRLDDIQETNRVQHRALISKEHFYLWMIATDPEQQGKRAGTALLKALNAIADREGKSLYLEAGGAQKAELYKRFGYGVERIVDNIAPKSTFYMVREPSSSKR